MENNMKTANSSTFFVVLRESPSFFSSFLLPLHQMQGHKSPEIKLSHRTNVPNSPPWDISLLNFSKSHKFTFYGHFQAEFNKLPDKCTLQTEGRENERRLGEKQGFLDEGMK